MNRYDIKVYTKEWTYIRTINPNVIMNDISFSSTTNWWLGELDLMLWIYFRDTTYICWELVKVFLFNERYKQGKQIYMWYISRISRIMDTNKWYVKLTVLGIASLLNNVLYSGNFSGTVSSILTNIISSFNGKYPWSLITIWWIDTYPGTLNIEFKEWTTCKSAINMINEICNYYWFVDSEWKFWFKDKNNTTTHILTNEVNVESLTVTTSIESVVNSIYVQIKNWSIKQYQSATSQNTYWIKERFDNQTSIADVTTQDDYWNNYIANYEEAKDDSSIVVNDLYDIESIKPWDKIDVVNLWFELRGLIIEKVKYTPARVTLSLEDNETIWGVIND